MPPSQGPQRCVGGGVTRWMNYYHGRPHRKYIPSMLPWPRPQANVRAKHVDYVCGLQQYSHTVVVYMQGVLLVLETVRVDT